jgi:hypothetical protein
MTWGRAREVEVHRDGDDYDPFHRPGNHELRVGHRRDFGVFEDDVLLRLPEVDITAHSSARSQPGRRHRVAPRLSPSSPFPPAKRCDARRPIQPASSRRCASTTAAPRPARCSSSGPGAFAQLVVGQTEAGLAVSHPSGQALGFGALLRFERARSLALGLQLLIDLEDVVAREAPELGRSSAPRVGRSTAFTHQARFRRPPLALCPSAETAAGTPPAAISPAAVNRARRPVCLRSVST